MLTEENDKVRESDLLIKVYNLKENLSNKNVRFIEEQIIKNCKCKIDKISSEVLRKFNSMVTFWVVIIK